MQSNDVCVVGLGYIGLPLAVAVATSGNNVIGIDVNIDVVEQVNKGQTNVNEPGLSKLLGEAVSSGFFSATSSPCSADTYVIAVPTPFDRFSKEPDLSYVTAAVASIIPVLSAGSQVIIESTCPIGTTLSVAEDIRVARPDLIVSNGSNCDIAEVFVSYCPERILPGNAIYELVNNDRVVGGVGAKSAQLAADFYKKFVVGQISLATSASVAEAIKLTENSFRDVNIAFANELSMICAKLDCDVSEVISLANRHPRVNVLNPGPGVGGHCIAVDPYFLINSARDEAPLLTTARRVNDAKSQWVVREILEKQTSAAAELKVPKNEFCLVCHGLAYKPDIDDMRESPAIRIVSELAMHLDQSIKVTEPNIDKLPTALEGLASLVPLDASFEDPALHIILVAHKQYSEVTWPWDDTLNFCGLEKVQLLP